MTDAADLTHENAWPLRRLYFYLTAGCNMKCRHCWLAPKYAMPDRQYGRLDFELFRAVIGQAKPLGLAGVKLTGGEPLLHPRIADMIAFVKAEELGLTVETNGVLCTPELAARIAAGKNAFVSVSLDGADAPTHEWVRGVPGSFGAAVRGIENLAAAGLKPQVIMSVMRRNRGQMAAVADLAVGLGAGSLKFNVVMPAARGETLQQQGETLTVEELLATGVWVEGELAPRSPIRIFYHHPAAFRPLHAMFGDTGDGCGACGIKGILGVLADGAYALCGIGVSVPEMVFGHAGRDKLADVWHRNAVLKEIREGLPQRLEGICGDCLMKELCLGSCIAQNYYRSKSLWAPFWYCEEAHRTALFPASRRRDANGATRY